MYQKCQIFHKDRRPKFKKTGRIKNKRKAKLRTIFDFC